MIYIEGDPTSDEVLFTIARCAEHVVILNDHSMDHEEADLEVICQLLKLKEIRKKNDLRFHITFEMFREQNQRLVGNESHTDHIVLSSLSSMILSQAAESPEMISAFHELFSHSGNEICLKNVGLMHMEGEYKVRRLRQIMLRNGHILLGYVDSHQNSNYFNDIDETVTLSSEGSLIVITKENVLSRRES